MVRAPRHSIRPLLGTLLLAVAALLPLAGGAGAEAPERLTVYRSPACGCCTKWADHMRAAGFAVELRELRSLARVKAAHGVPQRLASCHTAIVGGYVVEGHVPADDVKRLLAEQPPVAGLAVPGMPIGSPGMEGPDPERYQVLTFDGNGHVDVFATHGPGADAPMRDTGR